MKQVTLLLIVLFLTNCYSQNTGNIETATAFISSLNDKQKEKVLIALDSDIRTKWHFFPASMFQREGIPLKELNDSQKDLLHQLLKAYLSDSGYKKTTDAIEFEGILGELDVNGTINRDNELYYITFYGNPSTDKPWGWSFEGHHLSLNFTVDNNLVTYVPLFYGASPAIVPSGPQKGRRALENEEDAALKLINMLDDKQKEKAIFQNTALNDIVTGNNSEITPFNPVGISVSNLNKKQQQALFELIEVYISSMPDGLAKMRMDKIKSEEINDIHFGWAGKTELGKPHYYRIQGKTFLIELDNTQNGANHIHRVWREFDGDFGRNLIKEHYETSHQH